MSAMSARFFEAAKRWICDGYFAEIRYIAINDDAPHLLCGAINLNPIANLQSEPISLEIGRFMVKRIQIGPIPRDNAFTCISASTSGQISLGEICLGLNQSPNMEHSSEGEQRDRWFQPLHLKTLVRRPYEFHATELTELEDALRSYITPFDGIDDLCTWMGLPSLAKNDFLPQLETLILPPVDLAMWKGNELQNQQLSLTLSAHKNFDISKMALGLRLAPGSLVGSRAQVAHRIAWDNNNPEYNTGTLSIDVGTSHIALAMLSIENTTVRRQWYGDPTKSENPRYLAVQQFDRELKRLREAAFISNNSDQFEKSICNLGFILGFSTAPQTETNAPDILMISPLGKMLLVECTLKVSDIHSKAGKLIDRKNSLSLDLRSQNDFRDIVAILVCRQPSNNTALRVKEMKEMGVHILTTEGLEAAFDRASGPPQADEILEQLLSWLPTS